MSTTKKGTPGSAGTTGGPGTDGHPNGYAGGNGGAGGLAAGGAIYATGSLTLADVQIVGATDGGRGAPTRPGRTSHGDAADLR